MKESELYTGMKVKVTGLNADSPLNGEWSVASKIGVLGGLDLNHRVRLWRPAALVGSHQCVIDVLPKDLVKSDG